MLTVPVAVTVLVAYIGWMFWYARRSRRETDKAIEGLMTAITDLVDKSVYESQKLTEEEKATLRYMSLRAREDYPEVSAEDLGDLLNIIARLSPDAVEIFEDAPDT